MWVVGGGMKVFLFCFFFSSSFICLFACLFFFFFFFPFFPSFFSSFVFLFLHFFFSLLPVHPPLCHSPPIIGRSPHLLSPPKRRSLRRRFVLIEEREKRRKRRKMKKKKEFFFVIIHLAHLHHKNLRHHRIQEREENHNKNVALPHPRDAIFYFFAFLLFLS